MQLTLYEQLDGLSGQTQDLVRDFYGRKKIVCADEQLKVVECKRNSCWGNHPFWADLPDPEKMTRVLRQSFQAVEEYRPLRKGVRPDICTSLG